MIEKTESRFCDECGGYTSQQCVYDSDPHLPQTTLCLKCKTVYDVRKGTRHRQRDLK